MASAGSACFKPITTAADRISAHPVDVLERKRRGVLIGYSHCGCLDGVSQSTFERWSPTTRGNCVWRDQPVVCSNERNLNWERKLTMIVDLFCIETDPLLDFKGSPKVFRAPLTFALDPEIRRTDLEPSAHLVRPRSGDEVLCLSISSCGRAWAAMSGAPAQS
jgi:hypothetical protein